MPKFSVAFAKRKSNTDDTENADVTPPVQSSFRVLERHEVAPVEGAVRMPRGPAAPAASKPDDDSDDDNLFSGMKPHNRGSAISNTTHATYTDNSSRHSNASTAPSSADCKNAHDDSRLASSKANSPEATAKTSSSGGRSLGSKFLGRAGRTFSFGQKKHPGPLLKDDSAPGVPPLSNNPNQPSSHERARGMTTSSTGTAKPPADHHHMDDFDQRANMAAAKTDEFSSPRQLTGAARRAHAGKRVSRGSDAPSPGDALAGAWAPLKSDRPDSPLFDRPPPVPQHQKTSNASPKPRRATTSSEEEREFLEENYGSIQRRLPGPSEYATGSPSARRAMGKQAWIEEDDDDDDDDDDDTKNANDKKNNDDDDDDDDDDNLFTGKPSRFARALNRSAAPKVPELPEKVMTSEEYERYAAKKLREAGDDDSSDEINYDDDEEDELEKSKELTRIRRKQEATMTLYRQRMMKVTGTPASELPAAQPGQSGQQSPGQQPRPGLPSSMSAPQLSQLKGPQHPPLPTGASDEDDDEEVPLAILQAQGFAHKNRPTPRLNNFASNPNMRASAAMLRPVSMVGDPNSSRRHSALPAFARGLPEDPYAGAGGMGRPGFRESMAFNEFSHVPKPPSPKQIAGLIGIIDREEKAKALRRGSPSVDATRFLGGGGGSGGFMGHRQGVESVGNLQSMGGGMQQHMMYNHPAMAGSGMQGMPPAYMQQQQMAPMADHGHFQGNQPLMSQQRMSQYMQMQQPQPQFMNQGFGGQGGGYMPQQHQQQHQYQHQQHPQQPHFSRMPASASAMNLSTPRAPFMGEGAMDARRADYNMRTMSMVQQSSAPMIHPGYAGSVRSSALGYAPSVAPSERSNIGLPNRYRAVSQAAALGGPPKAATGERARTAMRVVNKPASVEDDDDDEQGWEAMKAKRDKRMSMWKSKKSVSSVI